MKLWLQLFLWDLGPVASNDLFEAVANDEKQSAKKREAFFGRFNFFHV